MLQKISRLANSRYSGRALAERWDLPPATHKPTLGGNRVGDCQHVDVRHRRHTRRAYSLLVPHASVGTCAIEPSHCTCNGIELAWPAWKVGRRSRA